MTLALSFPREVAPAAVVSFLRGAHDQAQGLFARSSLVFETVASEGAVLHRLVVPRRTADRLTGALAAAIPGISWAYAEADQLRWSGAVELTISTATTRLRTREHAALVSSHLSALLPLEPGERLVVQFVASGVAAPADEASQPVSWRRQLPFALSRPPRAQVRARSTRRISPEPSFRVAMRVGVVASSASRRQHLLRRAVAGLTVVRVAGTRVSVWPHPARIVLRRLRLRTTPITPLATSHLDGGELAVLVGWPVKDVNAPGLSLLRSRRLPVADAVPRKGRVLGESLTAPGRPVAQESSDLTRHTLVVGATGVGKSTLLGNMILSDIAAYGRRAVILIEPKGDLVRDVLSRLEPDQYHRVAVLDPADPNFTIGLNPLAGKHAEDRDLAVDGIYSVLREMFAGSWGPRLADLLYAGLVSIANDPNLTLAELPSLYTDPAFRTRVLTKLRPDDWAIRPIWAWYDGLSLSDQLAVAGPVLNKVRAWVARPRVRQLLGVARPRWSIEDVLRDGGVLLVSLGAGTLGQETSLLVGALLVHMLWAAITARSNVPYTKRRLASVYLDEWQTFTRLGDLGEALAMARGYGVGLTLANQSMQQIPTGLRSIAMSQTRTKIVFNVSSEDAPQLARELGRQPVVQPDDLIGLGRFEALTSLLVDNESAPTFSLKTLPLPAPVTDADVARSASMGRYGLRRDEVEQAIRSRMEPDEPDRDIGRRRRP